MKSGLLLVSLGVIVGCGSEVGVPSASASGEKTSAPVTSEKTPSASLDTSRAPGVPVQKTVTVPTPSKPGAAPTATPGVPPTMTPAPEPPKSNLPVSRAVPSAVRVTSAPKTPASTDPMMQRYVERKIETSTKADGSCGWKVESSGSEWVKKNLDIELLKLHAVEAVLSISEDEVKAWKIDGTPHPDFEGFIRLKLQNSDKISFPLRYKKMTRLVVLKIPHQTMSAGKRSYFNVNLNSNDSGYGNLYELSNGDMGGSEYRFQYVPVTAPKEARFAAIPALISLSESCPPVPLKAGQKFTVAGQSFEVSSVRNFQKSDLAQGYSYMGSQTKLFTTVVVKPMGAPTVSLSAGIQSEMMRTYDPYSRFTIDDKGNLVKEKVDPSKGWSGGINSSPMLQAMGGNPATKEIFLVSNLNMKSLTSASFSGSATVQATLENIPLEK